jgi:hypothetical protein
VIRAIFPAVILVAALPVLAANINDYRQVDELKHFAIQGKVTGAVYLNDSNLPFQINIYQGRGSLLPHEATDWFCREARRFRWSQQWQVRAYLSNGERIPVSTCTIEKE